MFVAFLCDLLFLSVCLCVSAMCCRLKPFVVVASVEETVPIMTRLLFLPNGFCTRGADPCCSCIRFVSHEVYGEKQFAYIVNEVSHQKDYLGDHSLGLSPEKTMCYV